VVCLLPLSGSWRPYRPPVRRGRGASAKALSGHRGICLRSGEGGGCPTGGRLTSGAGRSRGRICRSGARSGGDSVGGGAARFFVDAPVDLAGRQSPFFRTVSGRQIFSGLDGSVVNTGSPLDTHEATMLP
jgi:hypothetical protein